MSHISGFSIVPLGEAVDRGHVAQHVVLAAVIVATQGACGAVALKLLHHSLLVVDEHVTVEVPTVLEGSATLPTVKGASEPVQVVV